MSTRFRELDGLRGIAAVAVVWSHLTVGYDSKYPGSARAPLDIPWGAYGVQLFFFISGFVILMTAQRAARPSDFVISRASRLYPVYWVALTVSIAVSIAFAVPHTDVGWFARVANYTMVQRLLLIPNVDEVYWTLAIEMQFYTLVLILLILTRCRITDRVVVLTASVWTALSCVLAMVLGGASRGLDPQLVATPVKMTLNLLVVEWGPFFATGILAYLARRDRTYRRWAIGAAVATVAVSGLLHGVYQALAVAVIACGFLIVAFRHRTGFLLWRPVQWYGRVSYSLYIGHLVVGTALMHLLLPHTGRVVAMLLTFAAVSCWAAVLHSVGEVALTARMRSLLERIRRASDARHAHRTVAT